MRPGPVRGVCSAAPLLSAGPVLQGMDAPPPAVAQQLWAVLSPWLSLGLPSPPTYHDAARGQGQAGNTAYGSQATPPTSQLSAEEHRAAGMIAVNATLEAAWAPETVWRREKVAEELRQWMLVHGQGRTLADCTTMDVLLFMETWWIPTTAAARFAAA